MYCIISLIYEEVSTVSNLDIVSSVLDGKES